MVLVSVTRDAVIGQTDYFAALKRLEPYVIDETESRLLVRGLSLGELESLLE